MTITREHLELAALAGGLPVQEACDGYLTIRMDDFRSGYSWRPHTDIADAARLALMLKIDVVPLRPFVIARPKRGSDKLVYHDSTQPDMERAYCHAITLCAAEIGRRTKESK